MPKSGRGVKAGNTNALRDKEGRRRKQFPSRVRGDLVDAIKAEADRQNRPFGDVADEVIERGLSNA